MEKEQIERLTELTEKYKAGSISADEQAELDAWRFASPKNEDSFQRRISEKFTIDGLKMLRYAEAAREKDRERVVYAGKVATLHSRWKFYTSVAAVLVVIAAASILFLFRTKGPDQPLPVAVRSNDLVPGGNRAVLTLDNGQRVILDSARNGTLAKQGVAVVQKLANGRLAYVIQPGKNGVVLFNTITTPRGGQYEVLLPDGSKVWLNAASSLHYPTAFTGTERAVDLVGEAYFEVAKNALMPFHVRTGKADITVLGTHFNVNAYTEENTVRTTLLEGLVKVTAHGKSVLITPGQQAACGDIITVLKDADTEEATAWKDGYFEFSGSDIQEVMRQLSRWYDVTVEYADSIPAERVSGRISRNNMAPDVLGFLEASGYHFKINGRTIRVLP
jgi:ferric-dicitrate binding protein FerR (iron transport regulator)